MNIYNKSTIVAFYLIHPNCKKTLENWYHDVLTKQWKKPNDIIKDYSKVRTIKNDRAIFEINGSEYRLIAEINYFNGWLFIKFIGTHAEYDKVNAETIELY